MTINNYIYCLEFTVRDYECDLQGVVNNANYQHYLEHTRHQFLLSRGISFAALHNDGIDLIITRIEIDYKYPLRSGDRFLVKLNFLRKGNVRLIFEQDIFRHSDNRLIISALVTGTATKNGRPISPFSLLSQIGLD